MSGIAYPRRDDAVHYEQFLGTYASAEKIAKLTRSVVKIELDGNDRRWLLGDTITAITVNGRTVRQGRFVVANQSDELTFAIHEPENFHALYSKDGS